MFELPVSFAEFSILLITSFFGSMLTAAAGVGGGALVLVVMASILPPAALIPVHGLVQLGSNSFRFWLTRQHVQLAKVGPFLLGAFVAACFGVMFITNMQFEWLPLIVSLFILWLCWGKIPNVGFGETRVGMLIGGLLTTTASVFVGASGPLVAAWLSVHKADRWHYTANFAASMTSQHGVKMLVFGSAGFVFGKWLLLVAAMILCGYIGTKCGLTVLDKIPQRVFKRVFRAVLTLLAFRLLWVNYGDWLVPS